MRPDPAPQALLHHAEFVHSLARALVRDESSADDLAQDTWVAALQHPPQQVNRARAWLGKVLRNRARENHRRRLRRIARETACARPEAWAATDDTAARREIIELVARAVSALDEPYRSTVIRRHYEGLPPREIAREMHCPVETVKSRLKRAHARLRNTLDARCPDWRMALAPLTGLEIGTLATGATPSALGVLVVTKKLAVASLVVLVAALAYFGWRLALDGETSSPGLSQAELRRATTEERAPSDVAARLRGSPSPARAASAPETASTAFQALGPPAGGSAAAEEPAAGDAAPLAPITGVVTVGSRPAREGTVRIATSRGVASKDGEGREPVHIDGDGKFQLQPTRAGSMTLEVTVPGHQARIVRVHASAQRHEPIEVTFGTGTIHGLVRDAEGVPTADVPVALSSHLMRKEDGGFASSAAGSVFRTTTRTALDGTYRFTDLAPGRYVLVATPVLVSHDPRNIRSFAVVVEPDGVHRLDIGGAYYDPTWNGTVRYEDGSPVEKAGNLFLTSEDGTRRLYVNFDAEGGFSQEVPSGTYRMEFVFPSPLGMGHAMRLIRTSQILVIPEYGSQEDVVLPGSWVKGTVRNLEPTAWKPGAPPCVVFTLESSDEELPGSLITSASAMPTAKVPVQQDGTFRVDGLRPGVWKITGHPLPLVAEGGGPARLTIHSGDHTLELDLVPAAESAGGAAPDR